MPGGVRVFQGQQNSVGQIVEEGLKVHELGEGAALLLGEALPQLFEELVTLIQTGQQLDENTLDRVFAIHSHALDVRLVDLDLRRELDAVVVASLGDVGAEVQAERQRIHVGVGRGEGAHLDHGLAGDPGEPGGQRAKGGGDDLIDGCFVEANRKLELARLEFDGAAQRSSELLAGELGDQAAVPVRFGFVAAVGEGGARFVVRIPLPRTVITEGAPLPTLGVSLGLRVLVVDDERDVREAVVAGRPTWARSSATRSWPLRWLGSSSTTRSTNRR